MLQSNAERLSDVACLCDAMYIFAISSFAFPFCYYQSPQLAAFAGFVDLRCKRDVAHWRFAASFFCADHEFVLDLVNAFDLLFLLRRKFVVAVCIDIVELFHDVVSL